MGAAALTLPGAVSPFWTPASLSAALDQSVVAPVFCVEVTCGLFVPVWIVDGVSAVTWTASVQDEVQGVKVNGTALTKKNSTSGVRNIAGTWHWATSTGTLYVHLADSSDPNLPASVVEASLLYRFSDGPTDVGGYWWEPRLVDLPSLSARIPADFKGVVQIGGGTLTLVNADGFFNGRYGQNWDNGQTTIKMGVAGLAWADFQTLATFENTKAALDDGRFMLSVKESKALTDTKQPSILYQTTEFPAMRPEDVGRAKQMAYGFCQDVNPVCIDQGACEFQVADHAIFSYEGVRVFDQATSTWVAVDFGSTDLTNARFTLDSLTWQPGVQVAVDFYGRKAPNGRPMVNPAEVVEDILTAAGFSVDTTQNNVARDWLRIGYSGQAVTNYNDLRCVALYLDKPTSVLEVVEKIAFNARCYFTSTATGGLCLKPWRLYQGSGLPEVRDFDLLAPGMKRDAMDPISGQGRASQVVVTYAQRPSLDSNSVYVASSSRSQYTRGKSEPVVRTYDSLCWLPRDAKYIAESLLAEEAIDPISYSIKLKWRPFLWRPGDHLHVISDLAGIDVLAEILEVRMNLTSRSVDLKLGNLRGFDEAMGFWVSGSDVCPDGSSLTWAEDSQKQYRRHEAGHWHNTKDQATDTPVNSTDWSVSRWL